MTDYDRWITGGNPHYETHMCYCTNKMCSQHLEHRHVEVLVEYGYFSAPECPNCGAEMEVESWTQPHRR